LQAGTFRGVIQWQRSTDGQTYENFAGETDTSLKVYKTKEGFSRAEVIDGTCRVGMGFNKGVFNVYFSVEFQVFKNIATEPPGRGKVNTVNGGYLLFKTESYLCRKIKTWDRFNYIQN
jgi:hypothetical protein